MNKDDSGKNFMTRRAREKQELRFKILEAARELFAAGGEEAVTLRAVAEKIEYSATTIYLHFADKDALLGELCATDFLAFSRMFKLAERVNDPIERLRKLSAAYVDFGLQNPAHYRLMFLPSAPSAKSSAQPGAARGAAISANLAPTTDQDAVKAGPYDFLYTAVFKAMAAGCFKPEHQDVAGIAQLIWGGLHGVLSLHFVRAKYPAIAWKPIGTSTEAMIDCLLDGLTNDGRRPVGSPR